MFVQRPPRSRPFDDGRSSTTLPGRLQQVIAAAVQLNGDVGAMLERLNISARVLEVHVSRLRSLKVARTITLIDPRRAGRPVECVVLVRLECHTPMAIERFEARVVADPDILRADWVSGRFDYQLSTFHKDLRSASAWRRVVESEPYVAQVQQKVVRSVCGSGLEGLPLRWARHVRGSARPAS